MANEKLKKEYERVAGKPFKRTPIEPMQPTFPPEALGWMGVICGVAAVLVIIICLMNI